MPDDKKLKPPKDFYSDDVEAQALAENKLNSDENLPDESEEQVVSKEPPVTSGEMEIGDLDHDDEIKDTKPEESYDEESTPAGDNVSD